MNKPSELTVLLLGLYGIAAIEKYLVLKKKRVWFQIDSKMFALM